jgi:CheY-like chemotaxis protein
MGETMTVLLAEDEENDVFMMRRAFTRMKLPVSLQVAHDGEETIAYLSGQREFADRTLHPLPSLILLDIKMPRKTGFDVLAWLKQNRTLRDIPVVMLTSSRIQKDVEQARDLGARAYLIKPLQVAELQQLLTSPGEFLAANAIDDLAAR